MLEWYDFSIYGFFALQIGATFFPSDDPLSQALVGLQRLRRRLLARPLGAIAIGHIGDRHRPADGAHRLDRRHDRRRPSAWDCCPATPRIGIAAPILLTLLRLIQGLAVGGESADRQCLHDRERAARPARLVGAIGGAGYAVGIQLASLTALACASLLSPAELQDGAGASLSG